VAVVAVTLATALPASATMSGHDRRLDDLVRAQGRALIFDPINPAYLQHPSAVLDNGLTPDGRTVFAVTRGVDDFAVVANQPGRTLLRLRVLGLYNKSPGKRYVAWLERLQPTQAPAVRLSLQARPPVGARDFRVMFTIGNRRLSWQLDPAHLSQLELEMTPTGPQLVGQGPPLVETAPVTDEALKPEISSAGPGLLVATLLAHRGDGRRERLVEQDKLAYRVDPSGQVSMLSPDGLVARQGRLDDPALQLRLVP
jgi:hypothetical protein